VSKNSARNKKPRVKTGAEPHPKPHGRKPPERVVFAGVVRHQYPPFFEVVCRGTSVEFTDRRSEAHNAYQQASAPKSLTMIDTLGMRHLLEQECRSKAT
jgi:hypothetical protein